LESGDIVEVLGQDTGLNWTNGSTTISWANAWNNNNIFVGSVIFPETFATDFAGSGFIVVSKGAFPNFVIDRAPSATRTNIAAQIPAQLPPPRVGQTLIINDRGVTTATITAVEQRTTSPINKTEVTINQTFTSSGDLDVLSENCMSASVVVPTLRVTEKKSANGDCQIVLWRTTVNGTQFYRASSLTAPTFNSTTTDSVTFFDPITDGNLIGNEVLYTSGGVVENISPPAFSTVIPYKTRLLGLSSEDGSVWFSKEILPTAPVEWSDLFTIRAPEQGGKITALGQMDDKAILFKEGSMFLLAGDGPTATGVNNDFIVPQFITADAGCTEVKSVVTMPQGLMFKSNKGFYLLDRSLNSRYIGDRVEGYNALTVNLSKLIESLNQVRFALSDGNVIVYDYYSDNWYTYTGMEAKDATEFQGQYTYVKANGLVIKENPAVFTDNGTGVNLKVKTGWISFAGVQGFQRIYKAIILGDYKSAHSLTVTINQDFATTSPQTVSIVQNTSVTPVQYRVFTSVQKSESMQMTIQETGATGEGLVLSGIAFEFGIKKGLNKMPASKSYG
jgi:hypothetical protein